MPKSSKFNKLIVAGIAAAAIAPASAIAQPAIDGGVAAPDKQDMRTPDQVAGGAPGTGVVQDMRAPDQVDGSPVNRPTPAGMPQWAVNPRPIPNRFVATANTPSTDDGIDGGVLIALGGGALLAVGGLGLVGRKRLQVVRQRQLA